MKNIIKFTAIILWLYPSFASVNGKKQRLVILPTLNYFGDLPKYICHFYENKKCDWQINNKNVSLSNMGYQYFETSNHCSIVAKNSTTPKQYKFECVIYVDQPHAINIGKETKTVKLYCVSETPESCSWFRNGTIVTIDGRYRLMKKTSRDCSFEISNITSMDIGNWQCVSKSTHEQDSSTFANYIISEKEHSINSPSAMAKQESESHAYTNSPMISTTSSDNYATITQSGLKIGLSISCLIIIIMSATTCYLIRRQKRLIKQNAKETLQVYANASTEDANRHHKVKVSDEEKIYENIPQIIQAANETQIQPEIHPRPPKMRKSKSSNDIEKNDKSTEVIYTQVLVTKRMSNSFPQEVPQCDFNQVTYATIIHKKISQDPIKR